ncbi:hypothetical protein IWX75_001566 [Arthrobacter sp. CAN_A6]|uniref:hypothetical protein n=1 Tax=Arthrobacter sp. CAN_A6 TaxID=2787721 RepID=UPI0018CBECDB
MDSQGTLLGWAFGKPGHQHQPGYLDQLKAESLRSVTEEAAFKGVDVDAGSESFAVSHRPAFPSTSEDAEEMLVVRCRVTVTGPGADKLHGEGPMNGL